MKGKVLLIPFLWLMHVMGLAAQDYVEQIKSAYEADEYQRVEEIFYAYIDSVEDDEVKGDFYYYLGKAQRFSWEYDIAIKNFLLARDLYSKANAEVTKRFSINRNLAIIAREQGNYSKAREFYNLSSVFLEKMSLSEKQKYAAIYYNSLGLLALDNKSVQDAIQFFKKSIRLRKRYKNNHHIYIPLLNLATSYSHLEMYDSSIYYNQLAIDNLNQYPFDEYMLHYGMIYNNIGDDFLKLNDERSKKYFFKALNIYTKNLNSTFLPYISTTYYNLGNYYFSRFQYDSALTYYNQSIQSLIPDNKSYIAGILNSISPLDMLDGLRKKALVLTHLSEQENNPDHYHKAFTTLDLATQVIEKMHTGYLAQESKLFLLNNERDTYNDIILLALKLYRLTGQQDFKEKAFQYAGKTKYATLKSHLSDQQAKSHAGIPDSLLQHERDLKMQMSRYRNLINQEWQDEQPDSARIAQWENKLLTISQEQDRLIDQFERNYPNYYELKYARENISIEALQSHLSGNDAVLEYVITDSVLVSFLVTRSEFRVRQTAINDTFFTTLQRVNDELAKPVVGETVKQDYYQFIHDAHYLYNRLIAPHKNFLDGKRLSIIPDRQLALLAFEVLLEDDPKPEVFHYTGLSYLVKKHTINYFYAARFIMQKDRPKNLVNRLAAFAPSYDGHDNLTALNSREVLRLARYFNSRIFENQAATESALKASTGRYDILHLSMHAVSGNTDNGSPVQLVFSRSQNDTVNDGYLNAYEIYDLPVQAKLVTLSACNTGSGRYIGGEGILSLARAFHYTGCQAMITSLWPLNSGASEAIFPDFYKYLSRGNRKDEAMRKAKLNYLENNAGYGIDGHPALWSSMVCLGNPQPVTFNRFVWWAVTGVLVVVVLVVYWRKGAGRER